MPASLIRSRAMVTHAIDRHHWNEITDGAVLQEDPRIVEIGTYQEFSRKHPDVVVVGSGNEVMLPGFVNGHHHIGLTAVQLGSPDMPQAAQALRAMGREDSYDSSSCLRSHVAAIADRCSPAFSVTVRSRRRSWRRWPRRSKIRPDCGDQQDRQVLDPYDSAIKQLTRGRVDPMQILEHHQHGLSAGEGFELAQQCLERQLLLALRRKFQG